MNCPESDEEPENFANQPSYYHFGLLAVVTQDIKV